MGEVLHSIKDIVPLSHTQALRPNSEWGFKAPRDMRDLFYDAPDACEETLWIADECDFDLDLGVYHFPHLDLGGERAADVKLTRLCYEGAVTRFDDAGDG